MRFKAADTTAERLKVRTQAALGKTPCDLVIKGAQFLDVFNGSFFAGDVAIADGIIVGTCDDYSGKQVIDGSGLFVVPGFIDSHVHLESSLMTPERFQESVLTCGTTTAIWDPHEIANVLGEQGIEWALSSSEDLLMDIFVLLPSCVPATHLETSGAALSAANLEKFKSHPRVLGLAEMMNFPGVMNAEPAVAEKLTSFRNFIRDGHAPHVRGMQLNCYLCAGIQACHESTSFEEGLEKLRKGMHVLVREGSCAKDAAELLPLINAHTSATVALCTDDRNPADIAAEGHLDYILNRGLAMNLSPENLFRSASFAAARAYGLLDRGVVAPGYTADLCLIKKRDPNSWKAGFEIKQVIKNGKVTTKEELIAFSNSRSGKSRPTVTRKNINMKEVSLGTFDVLVPSGHNSDKIQCRVIGVREGQIITDNRTASLPVINGRVERNLDEDILKIAVVERHHQTGHSTVAFTSGFGIKTGAIASSIGHDSHNVIVVGSSNEAMLAAVNEIRRIDGGIVVVGSKNEIAASLCLPIGGLLSDESPQTIASGLLKLKEAARKIGCVLHEPFLQMSFLALPVIPDLKITDQGLVDVTQFQFVKLFVGI